MTAVETSANDVFVRAAISLLLHARYGYEVWRDNCGISMVIEAALMEGIWLIACSITYNLSPDSPLTLLNKEKDFGVRPEIVKFSE